MLNPQEYSLFYTGLYASPCLHLSAIDDISLHVTVGIELVCPLLPALFFPKEYN